MSCELFILSFSQSQAEPSGSRKAPSCGRMRVLHSYPALPIRKNSCVRGSVGTGMSEPEYEQGLLYCWFFLSLCFLFLPPHA